MGNLEGYLVTFVAAILSFVGGFFLWLIKKEKLSLIYIKEQSGLFPLGSSFARYVQFKILNDGNKEIENISFSFQPLGGEIGAVGFRDPKRVAEIAQDRNVLEGVIPLLNPKESVEITISIANADSYSDMSIDIRAVGVTAVEARQGAHMQNLLRGLLYVMIVVAFFSGFGVYQQNNATKLIRMESQLLKDVQVFADKESVKGLLQDQMVGPQREQEIMSILNETGVGYLFGELVDASGEGITYWRTGVFIGRAYVRDRKNVANYLKALVRLTEAKDIAKCSKGFLLYIAAKISQNEGDVARSFEFFEQLKRDVPDMHSRLMEQDKYFNFKSFQGKWSVEK